MGVAGSGKSGTTPRPTLQSLTARGDPTKESSQSREVLRRSRLLSTCSSRQSGKIPLSPEEDSDVEEEGDIEAKEVSHKQQFKGLSTHYLNLRRPVVMKLLQCFTVPSWKFAIRAMIALLSKIRCLPFSVLVVKCVPISFSFEN